MRTFKRIITFIILNILVFDAMHFALAQPSVLKSFLKDYHQGDFNTVVLGQSHGESGMNPFILSDEHGEVYNLARRVMPFPEIYYLLREADRDGNVNRAYIEIDSSYWYSNYCEQQPAGVDVNMMYNLSWRYKPLYFFESVLNKRINMVGDYALSMDSIRAISDNIRAKFILKNIDDNMEYINTFNDIFGYSLNYTYRGRGFRYGHSFYPVQINFVQFDSQNIPDIVIQYFDKIVQYCKKENIELIFFTPALSPLRLQNENHDVEHKYFSDLCAAREVPYYDMNYVKKEFLNYTSEEFVDDDGHMMGVLADRHSEIFKEIVNAEDSCIYFYNDYKDVLSKFQ